MAKVRVSTEVGAPVEQVFKLFTDIEHAAERVSAIEKIEILSTGPFNLGYRWNESRQVMGRIDTAIGSVSTSRAKFGTAMNRLEVATSNIQTMRLNLSAANSRIRDVDVATETASLSRNQVLSQAGVSMLAQANQLPQLAFGLLG